MFHNILPRWRQKLKQKRKETFFHRGGRFGDPEGLFGARLLHRVANIRVSARPPVSRKINKSGQKGSVVYNLAPEKLESVSDLEN